VEIWGQDGREVQAEGGLRVPAPNETIAAYRAIVALQETGQTVVGRCPMCGQPMVTDDPTANAIEWPLDMGDGDVITLQTAPLTTDTGTPLETLDARLEQWEKALARSNATVASRIFEGSLLSVMIIPVLCWLLAVGMVILYLNHFFTVD
jgi:hypothetical protein